ncbi:YraN family protein [Janthinobacterium sp. 1_2014MBL_MicDiv]|uniref:YraN family protein n=1 Tax=Janthinobacterium sp. 1_2014MBL_MicDiv TaxID=1644131 RepID=UPI0008F527CF|nr:YraN family protein [Janthinobacterium sp. 1_2014MBL_MicDiv]APA70868.1 hypothetical protein YQ44_27000 [Janthinobacterium sp. 1_2014MBL_MicDiv]
MPSWPFPGKRKRAQGRDGRQAEDDALAYLLLQGLVLLERNYLCRGGELDLIMRDGPSIVFVEVRLRSSRAFGGALASITPAKQRRMVYAAQTWLQGQETLPPCRFDALAIDGGRITWLKNILDM